MAENVAATMTTAMLIRKTAIGIVTVTETEIEIEIEIVIGSWLEWPHKGPCRWTRPPPHGPVWPYMYGYGPPGPRGRGSGRYAAPDFGGRGSG